ncbi:GNAT family N-acetyltransferase [Leisingera methylohalidivorans]|uniref:GNAT family acetyltransferase n=1 Tax=Leisingera methylohalidivorans DSM 14336 TaxID=999552 RepID=V9VY48_9RHOB|nr:GNAT family protein [Leisingera methylohalidivorans]AHD02270.1 GNAT family acetyltransferase [Leisingera methylohalidivorans DSM 14336]
MPDRESAEFRLRPLEAEDLATLAGWFQNVADLACFDRSARSPLSLPETEQAWSSSADAVPDTSKCWFAIVTETDALCGIAGLENISMVNRDAIIALFIEQSRRRQGIGIRALALLLDFAFRQIGLNRITSYYRADNTRSEELTTRAGFATEGRMRAAWYAEGRYFDMITVGLLREEWEASRRVLAQALDASAQASFHGAEITGWAWPPGPADPQAG